MQTVRKLGEIRKIENRKRRGKEEQGIKIEKRKGLQSKNNIIEVEREYAEKNGTKIKMKIKARG